MLLKSKSRISHGVIAGLILFWIGSLTLPLAIVRLDSLPDRLLVLLPDLVREAALWIAGIGLFWVNIAIRKRAASSAAQPVLESVRNRLSCLVPLVLVSRIVFPYHHYLTANMLFYAVPAVMAWSLSAVFGRSREDCVPTRKILIEWICIFLFFSLLYGSLGIYFTASVGEHSGDEGHYLVQARSLYYDGDLDIRNHFDENEKVTRTQVHISPFSRHGKWYSWHSPGLSFLLAPTVGGGIVLRHLFLGLIAGLGLAGVYLLAVQAGASRTDTGVIILLLGGSAFYGIYASRALPEILGATLATYGLIAALAQRKYPWMSLIVCALVVGFLPWTQTRFIPLALTIGGCYGLRGLFGAEPWLKRVFRLGVFSILCLSLLAGYRLFELYRFEGGSAYPVRALLFSFPLGLWHTLASERGILYAFPVFSCALVATVYLIIRKPRHGFASFALLCFLAVFLTSCATPWFTAGACLPGRFLLVVTPILMVSLALAFKDTGHGFRLLACYLGLFSVCMFITELLVLKHMGKSFADPYVIRLVHPMLQGLLKFFGFYDPYRATNLMPAALIFAVGAFLAFVPNWKRSLQTIILLVAAAAVFLTADIHSEENLERNTPTKVARFLELTAKRKSHLLSVRESDVTRNLFSFSNKFATDDKRVIQRVTTEDLGTLTQNRAISLPHLAPNDWDGRNYRWATLVSPFSTGRGRRAVRLDAELRGDVAAEFVVREGSYNRVSHSFSAGSRIRETFLFDADRKGHVYILVRLEGSEGEFICHSIGYSPFSDKLMIKGNLTLE